MRIVKTERYKGDRRVVYELNQRDLMRFGGEHIFKAKLEDEDTDVIDWLEQDMVSDNDPEDFEGGDLLLHTTNKPFKAEMKKGDMFLFPSFVPHSVTPVTKGVRRSLVGWVCGPNFV